MRIIGGKFRSRKIIFPDSKDVRPTKDRVREAIFSALKYDVENRNVLDLFAGSGAYGLEALSRGSSFATFVDINPISIKAINVNIKTLELKNECKVINDSYESFLKTNKETYSLVFLDPPYKEDIYFLVIKKLLDANMISEDAIIICEAEHLHDFSSFEEFKIKEYRYGENYVYILRRTK